MTQDPEAAYRRVYMAPGMLCGMGQVFSLRAAADACGVSLSTVRRRRESGQFPNAYKGPDGWLIPLADLLAAGLRVNAPAGPDEQPVSKTSEPMNGGLAQALADLAEEREARARAETEARHLREIVAMQNAHLDDMRTAMRALTAGPVSEPEHVPEHAQSDGHEHPVSEPELPRARRWWRGRSG